MHIQQLLSAAQIAEVCRRDNVRAAAVVLGNIALFIGIFVMVGVWTNVFTVLLGIILLGGRQLGFAVLVHECGHGTLFASRKLNEWVGHWLGAAINFEDMNRYASGHLAHHRLAGTTDDPDLPNYRDYPITRERLRRKLWRDLSGQTGIKQTRALFRALRHFNQQPEPRRRTLARGLLAHGMLLAGLVAAGVGWLYLLWWVAFLTTFRAVTRLRQVAEHAHVPNLYDADPRRHTRTIVAPWYDRLIFCPLGVNYHLEHHLLASVPIYNLPRMHRMLRDAGHYEEVQFPANYLQMLRQVTAHPAPAA